jgi:hypothetical protein
MGKHTAALLKLPLHTLTDDQLVMMARDVTPSSPTAELVLTEICDRIAESLRDS